MNSQKKVLRTAIIGMLTALTILLAFTPVGFLKIGVIEITFLQIPVIVGAILLGEKAGALLGGVFGLASFVQCFGLSYFGAMLLSINPLLTFIVCVVPRILMGFFVGLIFRLMYKSIKGKKVLTFGVASFSGALLNTIFFMTALMLCFYSTDYIQSLASAADVTNVFSLVVVLVGLNGVVEAIACALIGTAVSIPLYSLQDRYTA